MLVLSEHEADRIHKAQENALLICELEESVSQNAKTGNSEPKETPGTFLVHFMQTSMLDDRV